MDPEAFVSTLGGIQTLNGTEGPRRNIFEPKFEARKEAETLQRTLLNAMKDDPSDQAQQQLCQVWLFLAMNLFETEEDKEAMATLLVTYRIMEHSVAGTRYNFFPDAGEVPPPGEGQFPPSLAVNKKQGWETRTLKDVLSAEEAPSSAANGFRGVELFIDVANSFGILLSSRQDCRERLDDARKVLHVAERCYTAWVRWWEGPQGKCSLAAVPLSDTGDVVAPAETPALKVAEFKERKRMDDLGTQNIFYLAQAYGALGHADNSSKYCHLTMVRQMLGKKEFSRKEWATNAVHLSGYYNTLNAYGMSLHCLQAARAVMPTDDPSEETLGTVAWGFVKFAKGRLGHARDHPDDAAGTSVQDFLLRHPWWVDFPVPGVAPPADVAPITDFPSAREVFKLGNRECQEACKWYTY